MILVKMRRFARELVLQGLYAAEMTEDSPNKIIEDLVRRHNVDAETREFIERLLNIKIGLESKSKND